MINGLLPLRNSLTLRDELFAPIEHQFDKFFIDFFRPNTLDAVKASNGYPKIDVIEDNENFIIRAAVPGVKIDDLSVELTPADSNQAANIRISGQMNQEFKSDGASYYCRELHKSRFSRVLTLPDYLDGNEPVVELNDGLLTLKWKHKKDEAVKSTVKKLQIKTTPE